MSQLRLPLGLPETSASEFLIGESNLRAVQMLERWATWPVMSALVIGPRKSGRSLLARIFASKSGGIILDDADRMEDVDVFHAWNQAQEERRPMLMVAEAAPPLWPVQLPDLASRLAASPLLEIGAPDDVLMPQLLERVFERHLVYAMPEVVHWISARIERSHVAVLRVADALQAAGVQRLSIPVARNILVEAGLLPARDTEQVT